MSENTDRPVPKPGPGLFPKGSAEGATFHQIEGPRTMVKPSSGHGEGVNSPKSRQATAPFTAGRVLGCPFGSDREGDPEEEDWEADVEEDEGPEDIVLVPITVSDSEQMDRLRKRLMGDPAYTAKSKVINWPTSPEEEEEMGIYRGTPPMSEGSANPDYFLANSGKGAGDYGAFGKINLPKRPSFRKWSKAEELAEKTLKGADQSPTQGADLTFQEQLTSGMDPEPTTLEEAKMVIDYKNMCLENAHSRWSDEMDENEKHRSLYNEGLEQVDYLLRVVEKMEDLLESKERRVDLYRRIADSRKKSYEAALKRAERAEAEQKHMLNDLRGNLESAWQAD